MADTVVVDAFWAQLLSDRHLARSPAAAAAAIDTPRGGHLVRIGPAID